MLKGLIALATYGTYSGGGQFGNLLSQWEQMGVFDYMLPFLLIFSLVFGILSKMKLFGDTNNKTINAIIALAVGLMALRFDIVPMFFADILPRLGMALAGILVLLIMMGLFGDKKNNVFLNVLMWGSFGVAVLIILQSMNVFSSGSPDILGFIPPSWIPWIAIIALIAMVAGSATPKTQNAVESAIASAFGN